MTAYVDIVFDGPPSHESGRFVEVENDKGESIRFGEWMHRPDGYWVLRVPQRGEAADALKSPVANPQSNEEAVVQPNTGGWPSEDEIARLAERLRGKKSYDSTNGPYWDVKPDPDCTRAAELLSLLPARETASGGWNEAIEAAAALMDAEAAFAGESLAAVKRGPGVFSNHEYWSSRKTLGERYAEAIRALNRVTDREIDARFHSKLSKT